MSTSLLTMSALAALALAAAPRGLAQDTTQVVSLSSSGQPADAASDRSIVSADGRYVVFESLAGNLSLIDFNAAQDIFRHDTRTGTTELVSVNSSGTASGEALSRSPSCSDDGRLIAFTSSANDIVPGDTNGFDDVYVRDMMTGITVLVSVDEQGVPGAFYSRDPQISRGGRYVVFSSGSALTSDDGNALEDVYVFDRVLRQPTLVSVAANGTPTNDESFAGRASDDGRYVAFFSSASNLISADQNGRGDIFVKDLTTGEVKRVSESASGAGANEAVGSYDVSGDGSIAAFSSLASNMVPGDTNSQWDVFAKDLATGEVERLTLSPLGTQVANTGVQQTQVRLSQDGNLVAFDSEERWLVTKDFNNRRDVFVRDRSAGVTERISVTSAAAPSNGASWRAAISSSGRYVAFQSGATNLVSGSAVLPDQIYLRDRFGDGGIGTNFCENGTFSNGRVGRLSATGGASIIANDLTLVAGDLPSDSFAFFITSKVPTATPNVAPSQLQYICTGGGVGRYVGPGQIQNTGAAGTISIPLDLAAMPQPTGVEAAVAGETWYFQCWSRDTYMGQPSSNFTDALAITFE